MSESGAIPLHAWLIMGVALFAVSSAGAVFEMIEDVGGLSKAAWRLQATSLVLLPGFMVQYVRAEESLKLQWKNSMHLLTASGICLALHFGTWLMSLDRTTLTHSLLFVTAHPLVIIIGLWLLRKPATKMQSIGALVGFIGAAVVVGGGASETGVSLYGDFLAFLGAVTVVGYLAIGRMVRGWMPLFLYAFPVTLVSAIALTAWAIFSEGLTFNLDDMTGAFGLDQRDLDTLCRISRFRTRASRTYGDKCCTALDSSIDNFYDVDYGACNRFNYRMDCWSRFDSTNLDINWRSIDGVWISFSHI